MNRDDRKLLGRLEAKIEDIHEDIINLRKDISSLITSSFEHQKKIAVVQTSFENHLKSHDKNVKLLAIVFSGLLVFITALGLLV